MFRFRPARVPAAAATCAILLLGGCSDKDGLTDPEPAGAMPLAREAAAPLTVTPAALAFEVPPGGSAVLTAAVQFTGLITAVSTDDACATVEVLDGPLAKPAGSSLYVATFTVSAVGVGECSIIVTDKRGRSVTVPVVVTPPPPPRIFFTSDRTGNYDIYTMALDGSEVTPLTSTPEDEGGPALSADGRRMLFYRLVGGERQVFLARYDGSDAVRVPALDAAVDYTLSPDGSKVAFVARVADVDRVIVMDVSGANAVPVSPADLRTVSSPKFIPGSVPLRLVFTSFQDLWQVNADGTSPVLLAELDDWIHSVPVSIAASPDGARIAFGCQPDAHVHDICVMSADGTSPVRLTADLAPDGGAVFAPDGRIVFNRRADVTADSEIWAINVDGTGLVNLSNSPTSHEFTSR